jgi:DNA-3-methyladenine glycosylase
VTRRRALARSFFQRDADRVARDLIGRHLIRELDGERLVLAIVETEAYLGVDDPASHAFRGRRTERVRSMYLDGGHAYVFFVYGMHHCLNVVVREAGVPQAVLLRAGMAVAGAARMGELRGLRRSPRPAELAGGPARLCGALGVDRRFDGADLRSGELRLAAGEPAATAEIVAAPRVGIDYAGAAAAWPLRFALRGCPEVSRPRPD